MNIMCSEVTSNQFVCYICMHAFVLCQIISSCPTKSSKHALFKISALQIKLQMYKRGIWVHVPSQILEMLKNALNMYMHPVYLGKSIRARLLQNGRAPFFPDNDTNKVSLHSILSSMGPPYSSLFAVGLLAWRAISSRFGVALKL